MKDSIFEIDLQPLSFADIRNLVSSHREIALSPTCVAVIQKCRSYLDEKMQAHEGLIYGINTGFGSLCNTVIGKDDLSQLQFNLVRSHACGMGDEVPEELVRIMLLFKILGLSKGHSGVQLETVQRLVFFYNMGISPVVYQQGSLGASGDLAPLAHLSLPLFGEGEVVFQGEKMPGSVLKSKWGLKPIVLQSKEGLALLNGTQFMSAYAFWSVSKAQDLMQAANHIAGVSLEAYDGRINPFFSQVHQVRNQVGQIKVAADMLAILDGSQLAVQEKAHVQDPYSFRCIPQVHGASLDAIQYVADVVEREINAVTDNPTIFPDSDEIISAGNFHGQPLALAMDFLAIALSELGSISERRTYKLISGTRGLPPFLVVKSGLNSGYMIPQYAQAAIVSQNKQLCTPASIDTIDSSNGQEDHVSMGANAATKLYKVVENLISILGIELMNASQAIDFRGVEKTSPVLKKLLQAYQAEVPSINEDVYMHPRMVASRDFIERYFSESQD